MPATPSPSINHPHPSGSWRFRCACWAELVAILLPQALMGVVCTYLLYAIVRRVWGNAAGIVAGIVFITTPVAVLMFRFNNPDALLILLMLGAAVCVLRGLELPADRHGNRVRTVGTPWPGC
ncbi:MAG: ArnT family glycosyltransferase [Collinsella sp.]